MGDTLFAVGRGLFGLGIIIGLCWLLSTHRRAVSWKLVGAGLGLQITFAVLTLHVPVVAAGMQAVAGLFVTVVGFAGEGARFVFGPLADAAGPTGFVIAFQILPTIVFFATLTSALYYLGVLQRVVFVIAWVLGRTMRISGAEALSAAGNIFVGQTEAPLLVKPYLERMNRSEVLCVMVGGMATIAGGVMAAYVGILGGTSVEAQTEFAVHFLTASVLSAPAALVAAKLLLPQTEEIDTRIEVPRERLGANFLDALAIGTTDGLKLALNVGAMLIAFTALVALLNTLVSAGPGAWFGLNDWVAEVTAGRYASFNVSFLIGLGFAPLAWVIGVPVDQLLPAGQLLGERAVLNEFVAYVSLARMRQEGLITDPDTIVVLTYALCGFSNFVSIGIQIGGISALAPGQRENLARLGWRALAGGTAACLMTACVALMVI